MDKTAAREYMNQGTVYSGQGKYEQALEYYDKAEHENPMDIEVYLAKGVAYANLDRYDEAQEQFEKALKINRASGITYYHLGSIAILKGDTVTGLENYNKAIANGFDDAQLYFSLGLLQEENGEYDLALRNYSKAIIRDPLRPDIRIRKAQLLIQGEHYPEALQALDEMILTNPDVFEGYHIKSAVLVKLKQYDKAEEVIDGALALFPQDLDFALDKVLIAIERKKYDDARKLMDEIENAEHVSDSELRRVHMMRAQISASEDNVDGAIAELEKAKKISEKAGAFDAEVVFLLANCHLGADRFDSLLEDAEQLLEKYEGNDYYKETAKYYKPLALSRLGRTEESNAAYREAIEDFRRQTLDNPGNLDAYVLRAMCLKDTDENEKALELIDYVIGLQPNKPEPMILKVSILDALGRKDEAEALGKSLESILPEELRRR